MSGPKLGDELLDVRPVVVRLGITIARLRKMAQRGDYPELLRVDRGVYRVRRADHEAWESSRWTSAEVARAELLEARAREAVLKAGGRR